jgi:hypothetical protein
LEKLLQQIEATKTNKEEEETETKEKGREDLCARAALTIVQAGRQAGRQKTGR